MQLRGLAIVAAALLAAAQAEISTCATINTMHRLTGAAGSLPQCPSDPLIITPAQNRHAALTPVFFGGCPGARCRCLVASHATHPRRDCNTCESRTETFATRSDPGTLIDPIPRPSQSGSLPGASAMYQGFDII